MTDLEELIKTADKLCFSLEIAAKKEKEFCFDMCMALERLSWEMYKTANEIKGLREFYGG